MVGTKAQSWALRPLEKSEYKQYLYAIKLKEYLLNIFDYRKLLSIYWNSQSCWGNSVISANGKSIVSLYVCVDRTRSRNPLLPVLVSKNYNSLVRVNTNITPL
jgi:hypothetical protein